MKKFFVLMLAICLFSFPVFAMDINLGSNLSFIFEPTVEAPQVLVLIPFECVLVQSIDDVKKEVKESIPVEFVFGVGVVMTIIVCLVNDY